MAILEAVAALAAVLAIIWLGARLARIAGFGRNEIAGSRNLVIDEVLSLDSQRRLILVACGQQKVLLMIGGRQDLVVGWLRSNEVSQ